MTAADPERATELDSGLLSADERKRLLSSARFRVVFTLFVAVLVLGLSAMMFVLVSRIFDALTPATRSDLEWKGRHGAAELAKTADLGIVVRDEAVIRGAFAGYTQDRDIVAIAVVDSKGKLLASHGALPEPPERLFQSAAGSVRDAGRYLVSWSESQIEGDTVGRVALIVSTERLAAGAKLKRDILTTAGVGAIVALFASLLFVGLYIGPLIRFSERALLRLEKTTIAALE